MPEYLSPGVFVEEVPSTVKPIAGVSTSTAAFLGIIPNTITMLDENPDYDPTKPATDESGLLLSDGKTKVSPPNSPTIKWTFPADPADWNAAKSALDGLSETDAAGQVVKPPRPSDKSAQGYQKFRAAQAAFARVDARLAAGTIQATGEPVLCTTFTDFKKSFGSFSTDGLGVGPAPAPGTPAVVEGLQNQLAHAVYGFFDNGGTRCYVMRYSNLTELQDPLSLVPLEAIDEISIVAAPSIVHPVVQNNIIDHCENMSDRFAILESPEQAQGDLTVTQIQGGIRNSDYAGLYFPRIEVFDVTRKLAVQNDDGRVTIGSSGHIAGIYARVDHERGVHKAPANEVIRGALDVEHQISRSQQDGLNPYGMNCIRIMNNAVTVWGARTVGGDANTDLKYINVRRTLLFLRKSIDHGTQWVVFEPNDRSLWAKIVRNVTAFLTTVWRDGALFGSTPQEAFYVKCDDETNPPEERDLGRVITEIGVAIVRPAEFVIFRIAQWEGPAASS